MILIRLAFAEIAAVMLFAAAAPAKEQWKTLTLGGEPGLTISVPAAAVDEIGGKSPDDLMYIALTAGLNGDLVCIAHRDDYPQGSTRAAFAAALATERREIFCEANGGAVSDVDIGDSRSFMHNGSQAAICTASYTDKANKSPGIVRSQMIVAAPDKAYVLTCTVEDEDQETAEIGWVSFWEKTVGRIQDSFRIPQ